MNLKAIIFALGTLFCTGKLLSMNQEAVEAIRTMCLPCGKQGNLRCSGCQAAYY